MIGLTYIRDAKKMTMETLADFLGTTKQNISLWENSPTRKIPVKYLPQLASIFRLPEQWFQKDFTEEDKLDIQICWARQGFNDSVIEFDDEIYDYKSGEFVSVKQTHYDSGAAEYLEWLKAQKRILALGKKVKAAIHNVEKNGCDCSELTSGQYDHDRLVADNITMIDRMVDIADRADFSSQFLRHILKAIELVNRDDSVLQEEHETTKQIYTVLAKCYQEENEQRKKWDEEYAKFADDELY